MAGKGDTNGHSVEQVVYNVTDEDHQGGIRRLGRFVVVVVVCSEVHVPFSVRVGKGNRRPVTFIVYLNFTAAVH